MQSYQSLYFSLSGKYNSLTCYKQNFNIIASLSSWVGWIKSCRAVNPEYRFYHCDAHVITVCIYFYPLYSSDFYMHIFASSEDPDEMPHNAAFHQGLHCLLKQKQSSEKEIQYHLEIITFFANSGDPDEMPHNVAFHQGVHCLINQKQIQERNTI